MQEDRLQIQVHASSAAAVPVHPTAGFDLAAPAPDRIVKDEPRTLIWRARLSDGTAAFVKLYRHRPPRRWYRSLEAFKVLVAREYDNLSVVRDHGIPCTRPLFWAQGSSAANGRFEILATEEIEGADAVRDLHRAGQDDRLRRLAWPELFGMIARMHRAGVFHCCPGTKNVLLDQHDAFHLADFSKSMYFRRDLTGTRMARYDLAYLLRGVVPIVGAERARELVAAEYGDPKLAASVVRRSETLVARNGIQHKRYRAEFLARYLFASRAGS